MKALHITPINDDTSIIPSIPMFVTLAFWATAQPNEASKIGGVTAKILA